MDKAATHLADNTAAGADSVSPIFKTYLEAHREANRRRSEDVVEGFDVRVERSPYGDGYIVRYLPWELLSDPDLMLANTETGGSLTYRDL